jgi:hypothetical protein
MKINESLQSLSGQKPQAQNATPEDFGQWFKEHEEKIATPTKQSSGDEYYWQHQNQLQQSALRFEATSFKEAPSKTTLLQNTEVVMTAPQVQKQNVLSSKQEQSLLPNTQSQIVSTTQLTHLMTELESVFEQYRLQPVTGQIQKTIESKNCSPLVNSMRQTSIPPRFKNYHLFIQGAQIELTLNLKPLNNQEQKEIIDLIQTHLKKKGLLLNRLIINGVVFQ